MSLDKLRAGDDFEVAGLRVGGELGRRLADMGLVAGVRGIVVRRGFLGGPLQVRILDYDLLLRRTEAAFVELRATVPAAIEEASLG